MSARIVFGIAATLLLTGMGSAGAASLQPGFGARTDAPAAAAPGNSSIPAYSQAGPTDPYNRPGLPSNESFGLTAAQLLGAAAACEQYHSDSVSLDGAKPKNSGSDGQAARADIDAAQQNMLDPAATMPNNLNADDVDCDRMSAAFNQLQWIEGQDQNLGKQLDQPDALPPDSQNKSRSR